MQEDQEPKEDPNEEVQVKEALDKTIMEAARLKGIEDELRKLPETVKQFVRVEVFEDRMKALEDQNAELRGILLRAKAQGRVRIEEKRQEDRSKLSEAYKGTGLEDLAKRV